MQRFFTHSKVGKLDWFFSDALWYCTKATRPTTKRCGLPCGAGETKEKAYSDLIAELNKAKQTEKPANNGEGES